MSPAPGGFVALAAAGALKASVLLALAWGVTALLHRRSAALRHLVWTVALGGALAVPLLQVALPALEVAVLPSPPQAAASAVAPAPAEPAPAAVSRPAVPSVSESPASPRRGLPAWPVLAAWAWGVGALALGLRLSVGVLRVWWLGRRASEVTDDAWTRLADSLARRLRLGRIVTLLREERAAVPMTWGVFRPVVLLPAESAEWSDERRMVVLAHELAHVRRWDALTQWVAHFAVVLHWYNPLVWLAARQLREERERACDDAVLTIGARPSAYADHLLTLVRSLGRSEGPVAALAMARRSQFEGRLLAILEPANPRRGLSSRTILTGLAAAVVATTPLAALRVTARPGPAFPVAGPVPGPSAKAGERVPPRVASGPDAGRAPLGLAVPPAGVPAALATAADTGDVSAVIQAVRGMGSSAEQANVLITLMERRTLGAGHAVELLGALADVESGANVRDVLVAGISRLPLRERAVRDAWFRVVEGMESGAEQRGVLVALLQAGRVDGDMLAAVLRATHAMSSDAERRDVLLEVMKGRRLGGAARDHFLAAVGAMQSDAERATVLTALGTGAQPAASSPPRPGGSAQPGLWTSNTTHRHIEDEVELSKGELRADRVRLNAARDDVLGIAAGGSLTITENRRGGGVVSLHVSPGAGGSLRYEYRMNDAGRPFDADARAWMREWVRRAAS
ncbi:M56 family metallopeptidase [Longimicrobium sp.]|uniref:M56 family metallopeptidase n=1 Tax=Longimicrobium sp. TaxID=2029185 RepID=UPI002EDA595E